MSKKKSVSIILAAMLTISIGITGCGPKGTESGSGSSSSLTGSDNLTVSGGDDLISAVSDGSQSADSSQSGSRPGGTGGGNGGKIIRHFPNIASWHVSGRSSFLKRRRNPRAHSNSLTRKAGCNDD